ncbi:hypothetical protein SBRV1_gp25 [Sulfolobales Beppu rod-shaped virus 1]|uniref:Uncharacterized protein n=1 Tax=Sulfolobales Beppu rod-shaped virus 1 TaxID=2493121 RepID=A0A3S8NF85_9VIRU|nr:hypothetical protein QIT32_gp25 [Sulfolobales Beppu rod-shaped virus 1]AZI75914.1 hypothetical protein SBRV1_gp25 [Sulfolobales Beppu rod-shaped virus 1]
MYSYLLLNMSSIDDILKKIKYLYKKAYISNDGRILFFKIDRFNMDEDYAYFSKNNKQTKIERDKIQGLNIFPDSKTVQLLLYDDMKLPFYNIENLNTKYVKQLKLITEYLDVLDLRDNGEYEIKILADEFYPYQDNFVIGYKKQYVTIPQQEVIKFNITTSGWRKAFNLELFLKYKK